MGVARSDRAEFDRSFPFIQSQIRFAMASVGTVAVKTVVGQQRTHVAIERDCPLGSRLFGIPLNDRQQDNPQQKQSTHHGLHTDKL